MSVGYGKKNQDRNHDNGIKVLPICMCLATILTFKKWTLETLLPWPLKYIYWGVCSICRYIRHYALIIVWYAIGYSIGSRRWHHRVLEYSIKEIFLHLTLEITHIRSLFGYHYNTRISYLSLSHKTHNDQCLPMCSNRQGSAPQNALGHRWRKLNLFWLGAEDGVHIFLLQFASHTCLRAMLCNLKLCLIATVFFELLLT